jgi:hypothetical protein
MTVTESVKYDAAFSEAEKLVREEYKREMEGLMTNGDDASLARFQKLSGFINQARLEAVANVLKAEEVVGSTHTMRR